MGILRPWRVQRGTSPGSTPPPRPPRSSSSIPRTGGWCGRPGVRTRTAPRSIPGRGGTRWPGALGEVGTDDVAAIGVAGQQHGMVLLDEHGEPVRDALLWNDTRSAPDATALIEELGGAAAWAEAVGTVPVASITATKLRWTSRAEPDVAARARRVMLPARLADLAAVRLRPPRRPPTAATPRAPATGRRSPASTAPTCSRWRSGARSTCRGWRSRAEVVGRTPDGLAVSRGHRGQRGRGAGDRPGAGRGGGLDRHLGRGVHGPRPARRTDASGLVAGFADARGGYLPLARDPQRRPRARGRRARCWAWSPTGSTTLALRRLARGGRAGAAALPRRRAHPRPPGRPGPLRRADDGQRHPREPRPRHRRGDALRAGRRRRRADRPGGAGAPGPADRRRLALRGRWPSSRPRCSACPSRCSRRRSTSPSGAARQAAWALHGEEPGWTVARETTPRGHRRRRSRSRSAPATPTSARAGRRRSVQALAAC